MSETETHNHAIAGEGHRAQPLTLATWNVRGFHRPDFADLARVLDAEPLALVVVQELQRSQAKRLASLLGMEHVWSFKHSPLGPLIRFAEGLAIFSTAPLSNVETLDLTLGANRFSHRRRIAQFAYFDRFETDVVNIHLASHTDSAARAEQLRIVVDCVRSRGARRCIVAGDFNATDEPAVYGQLEAAGFSDAWLSQAGDSASNQSELNGTSEVNGSRGAWLGQPSTMPTVRTGPGFTNPAGRATSRLDRVFERGFSALAAAIPVDDQLWAERSDHLPVFASLKPVSPQPKPVR
jgi:endonuclease/exonuclease/phosphatase family metal-dependent hydrolase